MSNKKGSTSSYNSYKKLKKQAKANVNSEKAIKKANNVRKLKKVLTIAIPALVVVILATVITLNVLNDNGVIIRNQTVMESEHFKVDGAMMTYLFWDTVNSELEGNNASFYKMYNLSSVADIDNTSHMGNTWREYFLEMTTKTMEKMLTYAHYSISLGKTLSEQDNRLIEEEVIKIEAAASIYNLKLDKYLNTFYGRGVKLDDIRRTFEIIYLSNYGMDMAKENISVSDDELTEYYNKHNKELLRADYFFYVTGISGKDNLTEEQQSFYSARAQYLKLATSQDDYIKRVTDYIKEVNDLLDEKDSQKMNAEQLEEHIKSETENMLFKEVAYNENSKNLNDWIFSPDRVAGETFINHTDGYGTYGVVYLIKPAYIPDNWKDTAKNTLLVEKEDLLLKSIDEKYVTTVLQPMFNVADIS